MTTPIPLPQGGRSFEAGERVVLIDVKRRRYLVELESGGEFHTHAGFVRHDELIGLVPGGEVRSTKQASYIALRPTLEEFVLEMPRGAQVIYPKDLGAICMLADIGPGMSVLESGVGSGALSMAMLRCGANVSGFEIREDFANRARKNVSSFLGQEALDRYRLSIADIYDGVDGTQRFDRVVLDLPEPWRVTPHAERLLVPGGIIAAYTPSITQASQMRDTMRLRWVDTRTLEVLHRGWHIEGQAVRPDHRMVGHTGFLTFGRLIEPSG